ncbi:MAG: PIN/TRAM domain-containing protein [Candidatus Limnocylindrales bacterium]
MSRLVRILGALIGVLVALQFASVGGPEHALFAASAYSGFMVAVWVIAWGLLGFLWLPYLTVHPASSVIAAVQRLSTGEFVTAIAGLLVGLLMGLLLGLPLSNLPPPYGDFLPLGVSAVLGLGMLGLTVVKRHDLLEAIEALGIVPGRRKVAVAPAPQPVIVVDTSAIIDGRIADIVASGFLFGTLVVPGFVLAELQHIADHPDANRRNRGRRGLEILATLQKGGLVPVEISDRDFPDVPEVDLRLVALARERSAAILTNDFNLNRVAELQGLRVLNVNQLANAVKPAFLPGEEMRVKVIQEGKEAGQGLAYLDDGTMIVVEGGDRYRDREVDVTVTRVLQTVAGRMVFAHPRPE